MSLRYFLLGFYNLLYKQEKFFFEGSVSCGKMGHRMFHLLVFVCQEFTTVKYKILGLSFQVFKVFNQVDIGTVFILFQLQ